jgi:Asp-tRNA(Asn)/Glu-tRNA(Gln) amidotransferase B subunit
MSFTKRMNEEIVDAVIEQNPKVVKDYKYGNGVAQRATLSVLTAQAMNMSEGMCDTVIITDMFKARL